MRELLRYSDQNRGFCVVDPLINIYPILDWLEIQQVLLGLLELNTTEGSCLVRGARFLKVDNFSQVNFAFELAIAGLPLPCIVKPNVACGISDGHKMAMLTGVSSLEKGNDLTVGLIEAPVNGQKASIFQLYSSIAELFGRGWALKRMVVVMVLGIGIGMVYFGMPLAVGNLGFDIYLAVVFSAATEIPACVATYLWRIAKENHQFLYFQ